MKFRTAETLLEEENLDVYPVISCCNMGNHPSISTIRSFTTLPMQAELMFFFFNKVNKQQNIVSKNIFLDFGDMIQLVNLPIWPSVTSQGTSQSGPRPVAFGILACI